MKKSASYSVDPGGQDILRLMDLLDLHEDGAREREERQRLGRYRLIEAAEAIVRQNAQAPFRKRPDLEVQRAEASSEGEGYDELYDFEERAAEEVKALIASVQSSDLPVYLPGRTERHRAVDQVGTYHEEVYWEDLNAWLAENEPMTYRAFKFPDPGQSAKNTELAPPGKMRASADWRQQVRDEATNICLTRRAEGKSRRPTKKSLAKDLEVWCRNYDVTTDTSINPDEEYIRRHVLDIWRYPD